jgi:3'-phosphoadenosine 5'-phosphosulfate sulfotransferase (PAPS reductase)/FAD synthetase
MMNYLSFGGGVNSTALLIYLKEQGEDFETIFVNHGGDWPETYEYVDYLRDEGYEIKEIIPNEAGCKTIIEYCYHYHIVPGMQRRFCTDHFKPARAVRRLSNRKD